MDLTAQLERIKQGDQDAFENLFDKYKNLVFKTSYLLLGDSDEADEALQEVFLQVYRSLSSYRSEKGAFSTWLYRITTYYCLNHRRKRRWIFLPLTWVNPDNAGMTVDLDNSLGDQQVVQQILAQLSDKVRGALILRYYGDLSYTEIAEVLGIPIGTVKSRLNQGLKYLQRALKTVDPDKELDIEKEEVSS